MVILIDVMFLLKMSPAERNLNSSSILVTEVRCAAAGFDQELWYGPTFLNMSLFRLPMTTNGGTAE